MNNESLPINLTIDENSKSVIVVLAGLVIWLSGVFLILKLIK